MLVKNVNGEAVGASMVRDSEFYIELAKFVQAYTLIISNPNEFLNEVGESSIDEKNGRVSWAQLVKILTKCDFGFVMIPTEVELKVYYNYALEIGSLDSVNKKVASVSDVADAQKHYYNFVDKAKDKAETEYLKQHDIYLSRESEMRNVDNELSKIKAGSMFAFFMMIFSCFMAVIGIVSFLWENPIASSIGKILPVWKEQYIGAIVLMIVGLLLFYLFDKMHEHFKRKHFKLERATKTIFERGNEVYIQEITLKRKLDRLTNELKTVQAQLNDKNKKYDVQENINKLKATNKYYQKYAENEEIFGVSNSSPATDDEKNMRAEDFAPVTLTREQEENLRRVSKEAIVLEGQFDEEAYKEQVEGTGYKKKEEKEAEEKSQEEKAQEDKQRADEQLKNQEKELMDSIDYIKEILGFSNDEDLEKGK